MLDEAFFESNLLDLLLWLALFLRSFCHLSKDANSPARTHEHRFVLGILSIPSLTQGLLWNQRLLF